MLVVLAGNLTPSLAPAQPEKIQSDLIKRVRLKAGQKAPFDGQLLSDAAAAKLLAELSSEIKLAEAEIEHLSTTHRIKVQALKDSCQANVIAVNSKLKSCLDSYTEAKRLHDKAIARLNRDLAKKNKTSWYKSPYLHVTLAAVLLTAGSIAVIALK